MSALPQFEPITAKVDGHDLKVILSGTDRYRALITLINGATHSLRLFFYIFSKDATGTAVRDALIAARKRGVKVWLIVDRFGSGESLPQFYAPLRGAGAVFAEFLPTFGRRYLLRNHQKMVIADGERAIIGGANIDTAYFADDPKGDSWHDLSLLIDGPAVARLTRYYDSLRRWVLTEDSGIRLLLRIFARRSDKVGGLRWLFGGPFERMSPLTRALRADLKVARSVDMIQAYFAPHWGMLRRLVRVERRGGELRVITAARSDSNTTISAARHCYRRLLRGGVEVYEYNAQKLHMKLIIVDDCVYVGSANFDIRSLFINAEIMLRIEDRAFAAKMRGLVSAHIPFSNEVTAESHRARSSWIARLRWLLAYFAVATLDYNVTRRNLRRL